MEILDAGSHNPLEGGQTFPLRFLVIRTLWDVTWLLLGAWTPPPLAAWRRLILRLFGAKVSSTALVYGSTRIWYPGHLELRDYCQVGPGATLYTMAKITIGEYAIVSQGAHLCTGSHDIESEFFQTIAKPIHINPRAWIAADAFVGPGVVVGEGAVLGACGVAFRDLEPWTVYAGNPAKLIKPRKVRFLKKGQ
jgi:putative colanic acid biosynthesis acetyltransferase WcaF